MVMPDGSPEHGDNEARSISLDTFEGASQLNKRDQKPIQDDFLGTIENDLKQQVVHESPETQLNTEILPNGQRDPLEEGWSIHRHRLLGNRNPFGGVALPEGIDLSQEEEALEQTELHRKFEESCLTKDKEEKAELGCDFDDPLQNSSSGIESDCSDCELELLSVNEVIEVLSNFYRKIITFEDLFRMVEANAESQTATFQYSYVVGCLIRVVSGVGKLFLIGEIGQKILSTENPDEKGDILVDPTQDPKAKADIFYDFALWVCTGEAVEVDSSQFVEEYILDIPNIENLKSFIAKPLISIQEETMKRMDFYREAKREMVLDGIADAKDWIIKIPREKPMKLGDLLIKYGLTCNEEVGFNSSRLVSFLVQSLTVITSLTNRCGDAEGKDMLEGSMQLMLFLLKGTTLGGPAGNISNQMRTATNQVHDQTSVAALEYIANRKKKLEVPERPLPPINPDKSAEDSDDDEEKEDSTDLDYQPPSASKLIKMGAGDRKRKSTQNEVDPKQVEKYNEERRQYRRKLRSWKQMNEATDVANEQVNGATNKTLFGQDTNIGNSHVTYVVNQAWKSTDKTSVAADKLGRVKVYSPDICIRGGGCSFPLVLGEAKKGSFFDENRKSEQRALIESMFISLTVLPRAYGLYVQDNMVSILKMTPQNIGRVKQIDDQQTYDFNCLDLKEVTFWHSERGPLNGTKLSDSYIRLTAIKHCAFLESAFDCMVDVVVNLNAAEKASQSLDHFCDEQAQDAGFFTNDTFKNRYSQHKNKEVKHSSNHFLEFDPNTTYKDTIYQRQLHTTRGDFFSKRYTNVDDYK